ncbi:MAG: dihydrofolate reductase [Myxococcaceae bacterium]|nr:dihydrofolate reductase [Myxococcaceae bacterium]
MVKPLDSKALREDKPAEAFKVRVDTFADVRVLRFRVPGFDKLSLQQKTLLYYLQEAALSGRDITYDQKYEHNLAIRRTLEAILTHYKGDRAAPAFVALLDYAKRVWFSNGIHHHYSTKKFLPEGLTKADFAGFVHALSPAQLPLSPGETPERLLQKLTPAMFDPKVAAKAVDKDAKHDGARDSANHFYVNLSQDEVLRYTKQLGKPDDPTPPSYGLNSQLLKRDNGSIEERVWKVGGMYGAALSECVRWLEKALTVTETPAQHEALERLIAFYRTGELSAWDAYSIAWVGDTGSKIDLIHGFIETYGDALDLRATYEALVQLEDEDATKRIRTISKEAQWFEDNSTIPEPYKKKNVVGVSARVIQAVLGAGDTAPAMPSGVNLPNANWIRQKHGSKSVTLGNVLAAYEAESRDSGVLEEFAASTREIARAKQFGGLAQALMVDMHEVIGHASGQLAPNVGPASDTLQGYAGTLEEARADLVALYYMLDPKLVELKLVPSLEVGRAAYDAFIRASLIVQLARVPLGERLEEAHMRNRALIAKWSLAEGQNDQVIERIERGGKTYYAVRDYVKLRKLFGRLLNEIQRIKSEGDLEDARKLVEGYGVEIDPALHKEVRARYEVLKLAPYSGFMQPRLTPVTTDGQISDVTIEYPDDFAAQMLDYAARYSFLPTYN